LHVPQRLVLPKQNAVQSPRGQRPGLQNPQLKIPHTRPPALQRARQTVAHDTQLTQVRNTQLHSRASVSGEVWWQLALPAPLALEDNVEMVVTGREYRAAHVRTGRQQQDNALWRHQPRQQVLLEQQREGHFWLGVFARNSQRSMQASVHWWGLVLMCLVGTGSPHTSPQSLPARPSTRPAPAICLRGGAPADEYRKRRRVDGLDSDGDSFSRDGADGRLEDPRRYPSHTHSLALARSRALSLSLSRSRSALALSLSLSVALSCSLSFALALSPSFSPSFSLSLSLPPSLSLPLSLSLSEYLVSILLSKNACRYVHIGYARGLRCLPQ
jgi:hypothetical protein